MKTVSTTIGSRRSRKLYTWLSVLVLVVGVVVFAGVYFRNEGKSSDTPLRNAAPQIAKKEKPCRCRVRPVA